MFDVPGGVEVELLKITFQHVSLVFALTNSFFLSLLKGIAYPGMTARRSTGLMVFVVAKTQPTKLMSALVARHVHAPLILLDCCLALGARLTIHFQPLRCLLFARLQPVFPLFECFAVQGLVGLLLTREAEVVATFTEDVFAVLLRLGHTISFDSDPATLVARTPLCASGQVHI